MIFAIQNIKLNQKNSIFDYLLQNKLKIKILPSYDELINSNSIKLKQFKIEDIFHRNIKTNINEINNFFKNKNILITGSAGSIGQELTNQILKSEFNNIILIDHNEYFLFKQKKNNENINFNKSTNIFYKLGSINDINFLSNVFLILI